MGAANWFSRQSFAGRLEAPREPEELPGLPEGLHIVSTWETWNAHRRTWMTWATLSDGSVAPLEEV